jgi:cardiolipin synthase A/B
MKFKLYTKTEKAVSAMFDAISTATKNIYIEMYIFSDDTQDSHDFIQALESKAKEGITIILILDAFGSLDLPERIIKRLTDSGIEVRFFRHWIHRTHRKLVIIDDRLVFLGGVNIKKNSFGWEDLHLLIRNKSLVSRFTKIFKRTYRLSGGKNKIFLSQKVYKSEKIRAWLIEHTPLSGTKKLRNYYTQKISSAERSIDIVTPYFVPAKWFLGLIKNAISRGVVVNILIPKNSDSIILDRANDLSASKATQIGAKVFFFPRMNHAKAILIDNKEGMIGSGNIDTWSFEIMNELGLFFDNEKLVSSLSKILKEWFLESKLYATDSFKKKWYDIFVSFFIRLIHPFL